MRLPRIAILSIGALTLACTHNAYRRTPFRPARGLPAALVIQSEISGDIFGQRLKHPTGLALDADGNIYICDQGNNRIIKFSDSLTARRDKGGYGNETGLFKKPSFVTVDNGRQILVSDTDNRRLQRFDADLIYLDQIPLTDASDPLKYGAPSGVGLLKDGSIRVADYERNRLIALNNVGVFDQFVGALGSRGGQLEKPEKVVVDDDDNVFVCDRGNSRLVVYDKYNTFSREISDEQMSRPVAAVIDSSAVLWVLDQETAEIHCFSLTGILLSPKPIQILGSATRPDQPSDIVLLPHDRILISDSGNDRLLLCSIVYGPNGSP